MENHPFNRGFHVHPRGHAIHFRDDSRQCIPLFRFVGAREKRNPLMRQTAIEALEVLGAPRKEAVLQARHVFRGGVFFEVSSFGLGRGALEGVAARSD